MIRFLSTLLVFLGMAIMAPAQELNCTVNLNTDQLFAQQKTDFAYFSQLKGLITEFMNTRRWTSDQRGGLPVRAHADSQFRTWCPSPWSVHPST